MDVTVNQALVVGLAGFGLFALLAISRVGRHRSIIGLVIAVLFSTLAIAVAAHIYVNPAASQDEAGARNEIVRTVITFLGGGAVAIGSWVAWSNYQLSKQGQITDRLTRAVEQLAAEGPAIRLGGIYALERIAKDSRSEYGTVIAILSAFVRQRSPASPSFMHNCTKKCYDETGPSRDTDVRTALEALTRLSLLTGQFGDDNEVAVDLSGSDLRGCNLENANLSRANLRGSRLCGAALTNVVLCRGLLDGACLRNAELLEQADLRDVNLLHTVMENVAFGPDVKTDTASVLPPDAQRSLDSVRERRARVRGT